MYKLPGSRYLLDSCDVCLLGFSGGILLSYLYKKYKVYIVYKNKNENSKDYRSINLIVEELRKKSPIQVRTTRDNWIKMPMVRGGVDPKFPEFVEAFSVIIKSEKISNLILSLAQEKINRRDLRIMRAVISVLGRVLSNGSVHASIGVFDGSFQVLVIAISSSTAGLIIGLLTENPLSIIGIPLTILLTREIEEVDYDTEECQLFCEASEQYLNKKIKIKMDKVVNHIRPESVPLDSESIPKFLECTEDKLSLSTRYKLKESIKTPYNRKSIEYFSNFIKKFQQCDPEYKTNYDQEHAVNNVPIPDRIRIDD